MKLTQGMIVGLPVPQDALKRDYMDDALPGFGVRVSRAGKRVWVYRVGEGRARTTKVLGLCLVIPLEQARRMAMEYGKKKDSREMLVKECSFAQMLARYWDNHVLPRNSAHTIRMKATYRLDLEKAFGTRPLVSVPRVDVVEWHNKMAKEHGETGANRRLAMLHSMFVQAQNWDLAEKNPAHGVKKFHEDSRERYLSEEEIVRWVAAVQEEPEPFRTYYLACLYTGARPGTGGGEKGEARFMRWADVDFARKEWLIRDPKNKSDHTVPLADDLVALLQALPRTTEFVFAGRKGTPIGGFSKSWRRVLARSGIKDLRQHDIRRTFGATLANRGMSMQQIMKAMNQKTTAAAMIYQRIADTAKTQAMDIMSGVIKGKT